MGKEIQLPTAEIIGGLSRMQAKSHSLIYQQKSKLEQLHQIKLSIVQLEAKI